MLALWNGNGNKVTSALPGVRTNIDWASKEGPMSARKAPMIEVGDLVKWYRTYACDTIVKDTGVGLVLRKYKAPECVMDDLHVQEFVADRVMYVVHRLKMSDICTFSARDVAPI